MNFVLMGFILVAIISIAVLVFLVLWDIFTEFWDKLMIALFSWMNTK